MIFMKKWKSLWIWIFCVHMLIGQWIWIASWSADKEEPSGIFLFKASGHNTAVCFKWFSFSGSGLATSYSWELSFFHFLIIWAKRMLHIVEWNGTMLHSGMKWSCFIWKGVLWSTASPYEAILRIMKHACRRMKRSLFRLHVFFCPKFGQKKWGVSFCFSTSTSQQRVQISPDREKIYCINAV